MYYIIELLKVWFGVRNRAQLVKFKNGKYGIRYTTIEGYRFHDFQDNYNWSCEDRWFETSCQTDRRTAQSVYDRLNQPVKRDTGEIVVDDVI